MAMPAKKVEWHTFDQCSASHPLPSLCFSPLQGLGAPHTSRVAPQMELYLWEPPPAQPTAWPGWVSPGVRLAQGNLGMWHRVQILIQSLRSK